MKLAPIEPPREFRVGRERDITLRHVADVALAADEIVTFTTASGTEYDVVRKSWGYYATPSLNSRLTRFRLRPVLTLNRSTGHRFVMLVEIGKETDFLAYIEKESIAILGWLDQATPEFPASG
ncbi:MAG: hypothetical protein EXQ89_00205 [Rhodospirillaceae bacterium]|nr:hypothetical protein [Rhodospirillaceae bacterium]